MINRVLDIAWNLFVFLGASYLAYELGVWFGKKTAEIELFEDDEDDEEK